MSEDKDKYHRSAMNFFVTRYGNPNVEHNFLEIKDALNKFVASYEMLFIYLDGLEVNETPREFRIIIEDITKELKKDE